MFHLRSRVRDQLEVVTLGSQFQNLRSLELMDVTWITQRPLSFAPVLARCMNLTRLELTLFETSNSDCSKFSKLENLTDLKFKYGQMTDEQCAVLVSSVNPQLEVLKLSGFGITSLSLHHISQRLRSLRIFDVSATMIDAQSIVDMMFSFNRFPKLELLKVSGIRAEEMEAIFRQ